MVCLVRAIFWCTCQAAFHGRYILGGPFRPVLVYVLFGNVWSGYCVPRLWCMRYRGKGRNGTICQKSKWSLVLGKQRVNIKGLWYAVFIVIVTCSKLLPCVLCTYAHADIHGLELLLFCHVSAFHITIHIDHNTDPVVAGVTSRHTDHDKSIHSPPWHSHTTAIYCPTFSFVRWEPLICKLANIKIGEWR